MLRYTESREVSFQPHSKGPLIREGPFGIAKAMP